MKQITLFCLLLALTFADVQAGELGVKIERNVPVPMRDGTILRADIHRPDRGGPYPVLVQRTPYGKDRGNFDQFVKAGYIVVIQDVRGRYESEGQAENALGTFVHDAEDGYDTIEWAAKLPGSSGKVGTFGTSDPGVRQWKLAPLQPPSLTAMSANCSPMRSTDPIQGAFPPFLLGAEESWSPETRRRMNRPGVHTLWEAKSLREERPTKWIYWLPWFELPREVFEDMMEAIRDRMINPHIDALQLGEGCKDIAVPNLFIYGWYDFALGDIVLFQKMVNEAETDEARRGSQIIIGPWNHYSGIGRSIGNIDFGSSAALDKIAVQIRWFDYWLKGIQNGVDKDAPVRIFVMGDNQWRDEQSWPLQRTPDKILYVTSDGHANTPSGDGKLVEREVTSSDTDGYSYDPKDPVLSVRWSRMWPADQRQLASRQDILVYQTEPLTDRVEVTGSPVVELYASSSAPDTDWIVRLVDVYPAGLAFDVSHGFLRARYRNGLDKPNLIKPGEIIKYTIRMRPTSNAFLPGHRIRLDITSSDFPNYDRNHNTAADQNADATLVVASQTIYHGGEQATRIILPWVPNPIQEEKPVEEKPEPVPEKQIYLLHQAAADGDVERVRQLLSKAADVNAKDNNGRTPLYTAVASDRMEMVQLLIAQGADVNAKNNRGLTPLHRAIGRRRSDIAQLLIAQGADINADDNRGRTPLYTAVDSNRIEMAQLLITQGADINAENSRGLTALHSAAVEGRRDVAEFLVSEGAGVDRRDDNYQFTALHYAARFGSKDVAELLIAKGADINAKDKWDYQPIHWAAHHDRADVVELLISKGADVNAKTSLGHTPLQLAKVRRNKETIELLLKHGAK